MLDLNPSTIEYINESSRKGGYPYAIYFMATDDIFQFKYLKDHYKRATSTIREYLNDGYIAIIKSPNAWRTIYDKESYYKAITDGWLFQLEDEENKIIIIDFHKRA